MVGWKRRVVAFHEAGHAVVAVYFGLEVARVTARWKEAGVPSQSAAWLARDLDTSAQREAHEKDAVIALAGLAAQRREYPDLTADADADIVLVDDDDMRHSLGEALHYEFKPLEAYPTKNDPAFIGEGQNVDGCFNPSFFYLLALPPAERFEAQKRDHPRDHKADCRQ